MAKRNNDSDDEEDQLREDDVDDEEDEAAYSDEDVKPKKPLKKKVEPNFKKGKPEKTKKAAPVKPEKKPPSKKPRSSGEGSSKKGNGVEVETNDDGDSYIELGASKRVSVREYKGKTLVDIREYYTDKASGEEKPGKKGISLNTEQFKKLVDSISVLEGLI